jgi:transcriptional regulator with XRE-family HTH domain
MTARQDVSTIRRVRRDLGLSQAELAVWLGVTQSNVSQLEKGSFRLTPSARRTLAQIAVWGQVAKLEPGLDPADFIDWMFQKLTDPSWVVAVALDSHRRGY